jgi:membrane peptidoglycan carboxypeptidase
MLERVVLSGTGVMAQLNGYSSAGKTGTAHKYDDRIGAINRSKFVSSFGGMAPADNPAIVIVVVLDEPRGAFRDGGHVAAPIFREIAEGILPELGIRPDGFNRNDSADPIAEDNIRHKAEAPEKESRPRKAPHKAEKNERPEKSEKNIGSEKAASIEAPKKEESREKEKERKEEKPASRNAGAKTSALPKAKEEIKNKSSGKTKT